MELYYDDSVLEHHGIKGQKWGIRRYQDENGHYTAAGKKRYLEDKSAKLSGNVRDKARARASHEYDIKAQHQVDRAAYKRYKANQTLGTRFANQLLYGPLGQMEYNAMRSRGYGKGVSLGATWATKALTGGLGSYVVYRVGINKTGGDPYREEKS